MGEKQKCDAETATGKVLEVSAKVAIVNSMGSILTLKRSRHVNRRRGELDWPGGSTEITDVDLLHTLHREVGEELPGTELLDVRRLDRYVSATSSGLKIARLFVAAATFPKAGIVLSPEHEGYEWVDYRDYSSLDIPRKYRIAVESGRTAIEELAEIQSGNDQQFGLQPVGAGLHPELN